MRGPRRGGDARTRGPPARLRAGVPAGRTRDRGRVPPARSARDRRFAATGSGERVRAGDPEAVGRALFNRLEQPAFALAPRGGAGSPAPPRRAWARAGALMSGSGSAAFAVCRSREEAIRLAAAFENARPAASPSRVSSWSAVLPPDPA